MRVYEGDKVAIYKRSDGSLVEQFEAMKDFCPKMWKRYLFFKHGLTEKDVRVNIDRYNS